MVVVMVVVAKEAVGWATDGIRVEGGGDPIGGEVWGGLDGEQEHSRQVSKFAMVVGPECPSGLGG